MESYKMQWVAVDWGKLGSSAVAIEWGKLGSAGPRFCKSLSCKLLQIKTVSVMLWFSEAKESYKPIIFLSVIPK